jgi:glyoxylase I family protein
VETETVKHHEVRHEVPSERRLNVLLVHHVTVVVRDLSQSARFYGEFLGMRAAFRPDFGFPGLIFESGGTQVHLIERQDWHPTDVAHHGHEGVDACHFALEVDDAVAASQTLKENGLEILQGPEQNAAGWIQLWFRDPDGYVIELLDRSGRLLRVQA